MISSIIFIVLLFLADRALKVWLTDLLADGSIVLIKGFLGLSYYENTGAAFSILEGGRWLLVALTSVAIGVMIWFLLFKNKSKLLSWSLVLIIAGGIGNLYDRIVLGYVVDYIRTLFIDFPIFNLADCCVCIGAALLIIYIAFFDQSLNSEKKNG